VVDVGTNKSYNRVRTRTTSFLRTYKNGEQTTYHIMFVLTKKAMTVQAISVASERIFSKGGCVLTDHRSSLTNEHASQLIFLTMNKDYIPKLVF